MTEMIETFWEVIRANANHYPPQAFMFVQEGLRHTAERLYDDVGEDPSLGSLEGERHVSGAQLCLGLRDHAIKEYGLLARTVLASWNIHSTNDFGRIVFAMVDAELMRKSDDDRIVDFDNVFDFDEAFAVDLERC